MMVSFVEKHDRPEVCEVEITPEMIEAEYLCCVICRYVLPMRNFGRKRFIGLCVRRVRKPFMADPIMHEREQG